MAFLQAYMLQLDVRDVNILFFVVSSEHALDVVFLVLHCHSCAVL